MASLDQIEGDSTESFVEISSEYLNGRESSYSVKKVHYDYEECEPEDEQESWETVPESEKDRSKDDEDPGVFSTPTASSVERKIKRAERSGTTNVSLEKVIFEGMKEAAKEQTRSPAVTQSEGRSNTPQSSSKANQKLATLVTTNGSSQKRKGGQLTTVSAASKVKGGQLAMADSTEKIKVGQLAMTASAEKVKGGQLTTAGSSEKVKGGQLTMSSEKVQGEHLTTTASSEKVNGGQLSMVNSAEKVKGGSGRKKKRAPSVNTSCAGDKSKEATLQTPARQSIRENPTDNNPTMEGRGENQGKEAAPKATGGSLVKHGATPETTSRSPVNGNDAAPEKKAGSPVKQNKAAPETTSRSPAKGNKAAPETRARSPVKGNKAAPETTSRSPVKRNEAAPETTSRSPVKRNEAAPETTSRSPVKRNEAAPETTSRSPVKRNEAAPETTSRSPVKRNEAPPETTSRSPVNGNDAAPEKKAGSPVKQNKAAPETTSRSPAKGNKAAPETRARSPVKGNKAAPETTSRSPVKRNEAAPETTSMSPVKRNEAAPETTSRSPAKGNKAAPETTSRSPVKGNEAAPETTSRSPVKGDEAAPETRARSPVKGNEATPETRARSPVKGNEATPETTSRSPVKRNEATPETTSRSPVKQNEAAPETTSRSPVKRNEATPETTSRSVKGDEAAPETTAMSLVNEKHEVPETKNGSSAKCKEAAPEDLARSPVNDQPEAPETNNGSSTEGKEAAPETTGGYPVNEKEAPETNNDSSAKDKGADPETTEKSPEEEKPEAPENTNRPPVTNDPTELGLAPADSFWTAGRAGAVRLRMEDSGAALLPPITVPQLLSQAVMEFGQRRALCVRKGDDWEGITYLQYGLQCQMVARGLLQFGLDRFAGVLILGRNSPEWFIGYIGTIMAGGLAIVVDPSCTAVFCLEVALASRAQIILLQDGQQLKKIVEIRDKLPGLKATVVWGDGHMEALPLVYTWDQLISRATEVEESRLNEVIADQRANQCCAIIYEKRINGEPRGAMLSHDNVTWTSRMLVEVSGWGTEEVVLSYLPLILMSAQMCDLWTPLSCGATTYFFPIEAPKVSLLAVLREVGPTLFLAWPGFWQAVRRKWAMVERKANPLKRMVLAWARQKGLAAYNWPGALPWGHSLANQLTFRPARRALGLDRCSRCYVTPSPVSQEVAEYYGGLGVELLEMHGGAETCGVQQLSLPGTRPRGRVSSQVFPGGRQRRVSTGDLLWGRHIFMGYLTEEETGSPDTLLEDGWLLTTDENTKREELPSQPITAQHAGVAGEKCWREAGGLYMEL